MGPSVSSVPILISSSTATNFFVVPQDREGTIGKKRFIAISVLVRSDQNLLSRNTRIQKEWNFTKKSFGTDSGQMFMKFFGEKNFPMFLLI